MLSTVLKTSWEDLTFDHIDDLVRTSAPEYQRLDFKRQLPKLSDFAKTVAAMINGGGGIIIVGIEDRNNRAHAVSLVNDVDNEASSIEQSLMARIEPPPRITVRAVKESSGDQNGVMVIDLHASELVPFAVVEGPGRYSFYVRDGQHRRPLGEGQIEHMYRRRFDRSRSASRRLDELIRKSVQYGNQPSRVFVACTPTFGTDRLFRPTRVTTSELVTRQSEWLAAGTLGWRNFVLPSNLRPGFKSIEFSVDSEFNSTNLRTRGWSEFHDDGSYLSVNPFDTGSLSHQVLPIFYDAAPEDAVIEVLAEVPLVSKILDGLAGYWSLARRFDLDGEIAVRGGILKVASSEVWIYPGGSRDQLHTARPLFDSISVDFSIDVADLEPGPSLVTFGKELLDDMCTGFGWPECLILGTNGELRRRYVPENWKQGMENWAGRTGVGWTDEQVTF